MESVKKQAQMKKKTCIKFQGKEERERERENFSLYSGFLAMCVHAFMNIACVCVFYLMLGVCVCAHAGCGSACVLGTKLVWSFVVADGYKDGGTKGNDAL